MELSVLTHRGEGFLLNGCRSQINAAQDAGVQNVDTGVDAVAHELDGLLDETIDSRGVSRLVYDDTILGRLLHLGNNDCAFISVVLVECSKLLERVFAGDVGVEDEEGAVILAENFLGELQRTSSA